MGLGGSPHNYQEEIAVPDKLIKKGKRIERILKRNQELIKLGKTSFSHKVKLSSRKISDPKLKSSKKLTPIKLEDNKKEKVTNLKLRIPLKEAIKEFKISNKHKVLQQVNIKKVSNKLRTSKYRAIINPLKKVIKVKKTLVIEDE